MPGRRQISIRFLLLLPTTLRTTEFLVHLKNEYIYRILLIIISEELLIDFRELVGEHSGENMGEEVLKCLDLYGLDGDRVRLNSSAILVLIHLSANGSFDGQCPQQRHSSRAPGPQV